MAKLDRKIAEMFVRGEAPNESMFAAVKGGGGWNGGGPMHAPEGTLRFWYGPDEYKTPGISTLYSYRMPLATRYVQDGKVVVVVNGDGPPTKMTAQHQMTARSVIQSPKAKVRSCVVPYSALTAAGVGRWALRIVDTTPDREVEYEQNGTKRMAHFLGEALVEYRGRYFVSGLDRNDDPRRRNFYLARLPDGCEPKTVNQALGCLRPKGLPKDALRQGEWFLVPEPKLRPAKDQVRKTHPGGTVGDAITEEKGVPIVSDSPKAIEAAFDEKHFPFRDRHRRHVATRMYLNGSVYVSGTLRDEEHGWHKLGDGKTWYRVVRNLADGSWRAATDGSGRGRVD